MKITIYTDERRSMGTLSGISRRDLDDPALLPVLLDEMRGIIDRYDGPRRDAYTGDTQPLQLPAEPRPRGLIVRLFRRFR